MAKDKELKDREKQDPKNSVSMSLTIFGLMNGRN
jgi:hypothetical protein